jgi:hypothetical protein
LKKNIYEQSEHSWRAALEITRDYIKRPHQYHEVIIIFDRKEGLYQGSSLGIALTLSFVEQLLMFYNPAYVIRIKGQCAFTGGLSGEGYILNTGVEIIKQKIAAVFFSGIQKFILPEEEYDYASSALSELNKKYPGRKLKLVAVEEIKDILNRRDIIDITKQKITIRTGKFIKNNSAAVLFSFLVLIISPLAALDWDNNPALLFSDGNALFIKNINGKVLFSRKYCNEPEGLHLQAKLVDIDNDGTNELIMCRKPDPETGRIIDHSIVYCLKASGEIIWEYSFNDSIDSNRGLLEREYGIQLIDTLTFSNNLNLYLNSSNGPNFSSAIFRLDLRTGERLPGTLWCSGHIVRSVIKKDEKENAFFVSLGSDNGFEDLVLFDYYPDTITSIRPTTNGYLIKGFPQMNVKNYLRFQKTDYDILLNVRNQGYAYYSFIDDILRKKYKFWTTNDYYRFPGQIGYEVHYDFRNVDIGIQSNFRVFRDSLVVHGILKEPFTDTDDYKSIIKNKILYWKDGAWVKRKDLD